VNWSIDQIIDDGMAGPHRNWLGTVPSTSTQAKTMVRFILSSEIRERIREYNELKARENLFIDVEVPSIEHTQLVEIASSLQTAANLTTKSHYSLANMLKSTTLYIEPKPIPKPVLSL
jgi:hypothetical protein